MSTILFDEFSPWYRASVSKMELIAFKLPQKLRDAMSLTETVIRDGEGQFIREAIREKLVGLGYTIEEDLAFRGSRKGIGGRPTHRTSVDPVSSTSALIEAERKKPVKRPFRKLDLDNPRDVETLAKAGMVAAGVTPRIRSAPSSRSVSPTGSTSEPSAGAHRPAPRPPATQAAVPKQRGVSHLPKSDSP